MTRPHPLRLPALSGLGLALFAAGCGGSSYGSSPAAATTSSATTTARVTTSTAALTTRPTRIDVLTPRSGARTGRTVTVRLAISGSHASGDRLTYRLDGRRLRQTGMPLHLRDLAPGHHRLVIVVAGQPAARTILRFIVRTPPAPAPAPSAPAAPSTTTTPPVPTTTTPPAPALTTPSTTSSPPPQTSAPTTPKPAASGGIPQGPNAGDGDADNNGGPTDGDGNI